jgi:hypothetical protein
VVGGMESGGCGAFVSADRNGNVREEFPEGCDNNGLDEPLHEALLKWKLKRAVVNGVPVQVTALMGFPFKVQVGPARPSGPTPVPNPKPTRIRIGGNVAAAKLVHRVTPSTRRTPKAQGISGTVILHCVIAKDGTMKQIDCHRRRATVEVPADAPQRRTRRSRHHRRYRLRARPLRRRPENLKTGAP